MDASKNRRVVCDSHAATDHRFREVYDASIDDVVGVGIHVGKVGDGGTVADLDSSAVIEEYMAMDDHVVAHVEVVAERETDVGERFEVLHATPENVGSQDSTKMDAELDVFSQRASIEHLPEPQQWLPGCVTL